MKSTNKLQEKILVEKLKFQDQEAYGELYNIYVDRIYRYIYFKVSKREEAEDLTSEVFLKTWQYLCDSDNEIRNFKALLYQIARNLVIDLYRQRSRAETINSEEMLEQIEDAKQQSLLTEIEIKIDIDKIEKSIRVLKDEYKDVVVLKYIEELSINEISEIMNKSKGAIRVMLHRALSILRNNLEKDHGQFNQTN